MPLKKQLFYFFYSGRKVVAEPAKAIFRDVGVLIRNASTLQKAL